MTKRKPERTIRNCDMPWRILAREILYALSDENSHSMTLSDDVSYDQGRKAYQSFQSIDSKQNRSAEGCSKLKRSADMTSSGKNDLNIRVNANGTGPCVRRSKRPLLASHTGCNVLWKPPEIW